MYMPYWGRNHRWHMAHTASRSPLGSSSRHLDSKPKANIVRESQRTGSDFLKSPENLWKWNLQNAGRTVFFRGGSQHQKLLQVKLLKGHVGLGDFWAAVLVGCFVFVLAWGMGASGFNCTVASLYPNDANYQRRGSLQAVMSTNPSENSNPANLP